ncbi:MAG: 23S rRNA (adenine(1618)-N(6))-methyltransferase RlmF [Bacteroidota bacterium]|nr:23S rRNA (adenine(1618)-N(6))-methyltransferase RlmF [Bacteroidota bacterium]
MAKKERKIETLKNSLHPRNRNRFRYDFVNLIKNHPELGEFVFTNDYYHETIDFANPNAVIALNKALLKDFYGISYWNIPENYLCPPIPGRADYIHYAADLLGSSNEGNIPNGVTISVLDIGVGANCIFPLIGNKEFGWRFIGSDIDGIAITSAKNILMQNNISPTAIEIRQQSSPENIFNGIIRENELFDLTICNPPFHKSLKEAETRTQRKWKNLGFEKEEKPTLNFGGQNTEIWCKGGEERFVSKMIEESGKFKNSVLWFTTLISKNSNLPAVYKELKNIKAFDVRTLEMAQGNKVSRIVAWTFLNETEQQEWRMKRWNFSAPK